MKEMARRIIAARLVEDVAKMEGRRSKEAMSTAMESTGADRVRVSDDDGTALGTVSLSQGRMSAHVIDDASFVEWVAREHPEAMVTMVDPGWRDRLLVACRAAGEPVDPDTGEVVPGVEVTRSASHLVARPTDAARERMSRLMASADILGIGEGDAP